jgi:phosphoribosylanthranilate isomerase
MTRVKICGLSKVTDAVASAEAGADFVGLVFAPSRRKVTMATAARILEALSRTGCHTQTVGVFVNENPAVVNDIAAGLNLDWVQLSGDESWDYCLEIERPIIKVIHVKNGMSDSDILNEIQAGYDKLGDRTRLHLLDTGQSNLHGGTGKSFNWDIAREACFRYPVIIAGGLNPDNTVNLIRKLNPWGVDVSSGVESNGRKDTAKIKSFIQNVRTLEYENNPSRGKAMRKRR